MQGQLTRKPHVAGQFYPASPKDLIQQIEGFVEKEVEKTDCIACLLPHAGYVYSGYVAGQTVSRLNIKEKIILLGPNHTGMGAPYSIASKGKWQTPLGEINIDSHLAQALISKSNFLEEDPLAHIYEHSLEVELPILQYFQKDFTIVPITILSQDIVALKKIGQEIGSVIQEQKIKDSCLIVASSDMTHYEPQNQAEKKDKLAIEAIIALDEDKLAKRIEEFNITMCGWAPAICMISAAKALGAKKAKLIKYRTSGEVTQDTNSVVGYAGIIIY